MKKDYNAMLND